MRVVNNINSVNYRGTIKFAYFFNLNKFSCLFVVGNKCKYLKNLGFFQLFNFLIAIFHLILGKSAWNLLVS